MDHESEKILTVIADLYIPLQPLSSPSEQHTSLTELSNVKQAKVLHTVATSWTAVCTAHSGH